MSIKTCSLLTALLLTSNVAQAKDLSATSFVKACDELVSAFDRRLEKKFLAGVTTSVTEAFLGGLCAGRFMEYASRNGCEAGVHNAAIKVSEMDNIRSSVTPRMMMRKACND